MALRELFSREEAEALVAYLDGAHGDEGVNQIKKRELPLSSRLMPLSGIPTGGGPDHYELWRKPEYNLPFKVVGFFDLRGYERIDGNENIAEYSGQMIFMSNGELILVGKEMERLLSEGYTSEQARAKIQMWRCPLS